MTEPKKPTPAELLDSAAKMHEALAAFAPEALIDEALAVMMEPAFQANITRLEVLAKALPEGERLKTVFANIGQAVRGAVAVVSQKKMMEAMSAAPAAG